MAILVLAAAIAAAGCDHARRGALRPRPALIPTATRRAERATDR